MYLRKECEELFSRLNFECRFQVFHFMKGLLNGTEKEKPPADAGTSVGGSEKNICAVIHFTASFDNNQGRIAVKG